MAEGAQSTWQPQLDNLTALREVHAPAWVSQPRYRGTWGVLYSCTITLGLCVYTAIHLNIPSRDEGRVSFFLRKAKWAVIAILAPEVVLYTAWSQWYTARDIVKRLNKLLEAKKTARLDAEALEEPEFDLVAGYYIVMGGFVARCDIGSSGRINPNVSGEQICTLTPDAVEALAREGHFLTVQTRTVQDKSKADILAKCLVCFQVLWMLVEGVARKLSGYPLALLEVHIFVHVLCALTMYALWFKKPMDIRDPTVLGPEDTEQLKTVSAEDLIKRAPNLGEEPNVADWQGFVLLGILVVLCAAYGGVHLSTWNFDFPTPLEKKLWKISCISTVAGSLLAPGFLFWFGGVFNMGGFIEGTIETIADVRSGMDGIDRLLALLGSFAMLFSPLLLASRLFLVVESFVSLRDVPSGVYATVPWAQYIPHI